MNKFAQQEEPSSSPVSHQTDSAKEKANEEQKAGQKKQPVKKRKKWFAKTFFGVLAIGAIASYGWVIADEERTSVDLRALKSKGIPISVGDYVKTIPHEGRNGAAAYHAAIDSWEALAPDDQKLVKDNLEDMVQRGPVSRE